MKWWHNCGLDGPHTGDDESASTGFEIDQIVSDLIEGVTKRYLHY